MSDDLYRVLYTDADGHEQLTGAMSLDAARSRASDLKSQGYTVGSVMGDVAARGYMHARYAPTYRGVKVPDDLRADGALRSGYDAWKRGVDAQLDGAAPANGDPFAPDLTMSREVADFVLRAYTGLLHEGYWPKGFGVPDRRGGTDARDYDDALILRAADIVGRDKVKNASLRRALAELDVENGAAT